MSVVDEYLKSVNEPERTELERIRRIVHQTLADVEEVKTYDMPGFKYKGKYLMAFAAFKDHLSIFPTAGPIEALTDQLKGYSLSRGTIRFTVDNPLPENLIKAILKQRARDIG